MWKKFLFYASLVQDLSINTTVVVPGTIEFLSSMISDDSPLLPSLRSLEWNENHPNSNDLLYIIPPPFAKSTSNCQIPAQIIQRTDLFLRGAQTLPAQRALGGALTERSHATHRPFSVVRAGRKSCAPSHRPHTLSPACAHTFLALHSLCSAAQRRNDLHRAGTVQDSLEIRIDHVFRAHWNNLSNMIFIDEPIGSGFSHGTVDVDSTRAAAPPFWQAFQVRFESSEFSKFQSRQFILSVAYGPAFVTYFNEQNDKIRDGTLSDGFRSHVLACSGWFDPVIHNQAFVDFATYTPGYGQLQSDDVIEAINDAYYRMGGCKEQLSNCTKAGRGEESYKICYDVDVFCYYEQFLEDPDILEKIGAESPYVRCASPDVERLFNSTGDDGRTLPPELSKLADSGMKILIWVALALDWYGQEKLRGTKFANMTLHGKVLAEYKNAYNFSFAYVEPLSY
ncbi:Alpha/Beta hydrolase protein [Daedaleopsis nitida]|nr:Alpha/Beta hydrolase protein [Daedaleopsis nitida]